MTAPLDIVDIHAHLWPPAWRPGGKYEKPAGAFSPEIHRKITTPQALVDELEQSGVSLAVVTATIESLFGLEASIPLEAVREANDWLATLSREHSTLTGFAVVDAFAGDEALLLALFCASLADKGRFDEEAWTRLNHASGDKRTIRDANLFRVLASGRVRLTKAQADRVVKHVDASYPFSDSLAAAALAAVKK